MATMKELVDQLNAATGKSYKVSSFKSKGEVEKKLAATKKNGEYNIKEAAHRLGITPKSMRQRLRRMVARGEIEHKKNARWGKVAV